VGPEHHLLECKECEEWLKGQRRDTRALHGRALAKRMEAFPRVAARLGFDSVQVLVKTTAPMRVDPFGEVVMLTSPECMARNQSELLPLRTCTPFLDVRFGSHPALEGAGDAPQRCACDDEALQSLNCAAGARGVDGQRTRSTPQNYIVRGLP
jgi:hypothetical protein